MAFSNKRGRKPQRIDPDRDLGTPELQLKRARKLTAEAIDYYLDNGLISAEQHRAAIHFRWLYTIKLGAPSISAFDLERYYGRDTKRNNDPKWLAEREADYNEALSELKKVYAHRATLDVAVFNIKPKSTSALRDGLDALVNLWF